MSAERPTPQQIIEECREPFDLRRQKAIYKGIDEHSPYRNDPLNYVLTFGDDYLFPVEPLTDDWFFDSKPTSEDIGNALQGRMDEMVKALEDPENRTLSDKYGLDPSVSREVIITIAYQELSEEYFLRKQAYRTQIATLSKQFEKDKTALLEEKNEGKTGKKQGEKLKIEGQYNQKLVQKQKEYNTAVERPQDTLNRADALSDLIKKRFFYDFFSPYLRPDGTYGMNTLPDVIAEVKERAQQGNIPSGYSIDIFLEEFSEYVQNTEEKDLLLGYRYKPSDELTKKREDFAFLHPLLEWALTPEVLSPDPEIQKHIQKLGLGMFDFLKRSAVAKSNQSIKPTNAYPCVSLVYDLYNAVLAHRKHALYEKFENTFNAHYGDIYTYKQVDKEVQALVDTVLKSMQTFIASNELPLPQDRNIIKAQHIYISKALTSLVTGTDWRLFFGSMRMDPETFPGTQLFQENKAPHKINQMVRRKLQGNLSKGNAETTKKCLVIINNDAEKLTGGPFYKENGIDADLCQAAGYELVLNQGDSTLWRRNPNGIKPEERKGRLIEDVRTKRPYSIFEEHYFNHFWAADLLSISKAEIERIEAANKFLWNGVEDRQMWFISGRGDRFLNAHDIYLQEKNIESITLKFNKNFPREYFVTLRLDGIDQQLDYWLTTDRQLLDKDRRFIHHMSAPVKEAFINMLLTRTFYVTSGMLSVDQKAKPRKVVGNGETLEFRRPHYRILTPSEYVTYTMNSKSAIKHREEIWEMYRIRLLEEEKRRWDLRTLPRDHRMTFVKGVEPEKISKDNMPNIIDFDPSAIGYEIYEWEKIVEENKKRQDEEDKRILGE